MEFCKSSVGREDLGSVGRKTERSDSWCCRLAYCVFRLINTNVKPQHYSLLFYKYFPSFFVCSFLQNYRTSQCYCSNSVRAHCATRARTANKQQQDNQADFVPIWLTAEEHIASRKAGGTPCSVNNSRTAPSHQCARL